MTTKYVNPFNCTLRACTAQHRFKPRSAQPLQSSPHYHPLTLYIYIFFLTVCRNKHRATHTHTHTQSRYNSELTIMTKTNRENPSHFLDTKNGMRWRRNFESSPPTDPCHFREILKRGQGLEYLPTPSNSPPNFTLPTTH